MLSWLIAMPVAVSTALICSGDNRLADNSPTILLRLRKPIPAFATVAPQLTADRALADTQMPTDILLAYTALVQRINLTAIILRQTPVARHA